MDGIDQVFVLNVKSAVDRRKHIDTELGKFNIDFKYLTDGDIDDIDDTTLRKYFAGPHVSEANVTTSCSLKHILAIEHQSKNRLSRILVFEDDVVLHKDFEDYVSRFLKEIENRNLSKYLLNIEFGNFLLVPKSQREADQYIYPGRKMRCAAGYIVDLEAADAIMDYIHKKKCHRMFDIFMDELSQMGVYNLLWSHPPVVEQLSNSGDMVSMIDPGKKDDSIGRKLRYRILKTIKFVKANFK